MPESPKYILSFESCMIDLEWTIFDDIDGPPSPLSHENADPATLWIIPFKSIFLIWECLVSDIYTSFLEFTDTP